MAQSAMLAPALLLTGSAVPVVAIRAVVGCARGDGFLCVWAEELWRMRDEIFNERDVRSQRRKEVKEAEREECGGGGVELAKCDRDENEASSRTLSQ